MKPKCLIIFLLFFIFFFSCREKKEKKEQVVQQEHTMSIKEAMKAENRVINYDSLFNELLPLENHIMSNPSDTEHIKRLLGAAYDSIGGVFYCVGKGTTNPNLPASAQQQAMQRAATNTGARWSLYLKTWQDGNIIPFDKEISGKLLTGTSLLLEKSVGDTLYQLLSISAADVKIL